MDFRWPLDPSKHLDENMEQDPVTGSRPLKSQASAELLKHIMTCKRESKSVAVFDLDSTLLNNFPRQCKILREFGDVCGEARLNDVKREDWIDWDFRPPMAAVGLSKERIEELAEDFRSFWMERFFTSAYCMVDDEIQGGSRFVSTLHRQGDKIIYVTGRQESMREGTELCLKKLSFPVPDGSSTKLWMKPLLKDDDDLFKSQIKRKLDKEGEVFALFDNEPTHINRYKELYPFANVIHMATDHSKRPVILNPEIPSIRNFLMPL